eukprot:5581081-Amphidinium_carterae.1
MLLCKSTNIFRHVFHRRVDTVGGAFAVSYAATQGAVPAEVPAELSNTSTPVWRAKSEQWKRVSAQAAVCQS